MRVALLIAGEWRQHELASTSWNPILDLNPDIYISTWNISEQISVPLNIHLTQEITEPYIRALYPKSKILINPAINFRSRFAMMIFNWRASLQMIIDSQIKYDSVILIRPDLYIDPVVDLFYQTALYPCPNTVYAVTNDTVAIQDQLLVSTVEAMRKFIPDNSINLYSLEKYVDGHAWLACRVQMQNLQIEEISGFSVTSSNRHCIVRPNCNEEDIKSFNGVRSKAKIWWEINNPGSTYLG